ncbi:Hop1p KNAG_0C04220 [Huiozyma naganishii CBS 8797]|uniref:HORMA domain-containing protein n=1 Tax=Huiozyma naganishii (strain ATCC MYA-139 / BCRC 22969 / CBS 8797 / KCTC 17520 / NBRC 10181 / NCYC 3082 / Yp74L-3) TaxID=1071383 RepID=J7S4X7_HUIN7|nr:hypothetical protein KNAG_0C04220 [Kazachstania naganishii CBS 8797]CCK69524.1 hypothetical protein KNAG_0C04220 [Kazachstania naganishii CBS 8797]
MSTNQLLLTKEKVKTKTAITSEQSQKLIQTMLTMSFGCLAFLRGLFPDDSFLDQRFVPEKTEKNYNKDTISQSNSIKIKTLVRGKSKEVDLLLDWLEKGVFQSIRLKYLKALSLGVFLDENNPTELLENYTFSFEYDEANNISLQITHGDEKEKPISLLDSRRMVQQLMRRFIIITQSLEPLPEKKFLSMRLLFNENTDPEYQPNLFRDATNDERATIKIPSQTNPDVLTAGTLNTKHHRVDLKVLSSLEGRNELNPEEQSFDVIDPFEQLTDTFDQCSLKAGSQLGALAVDDSQTTNHLGELLKSSQGSILPTQSVTSERDPNKTCDCALPCPQGVTTVRICRVCRKAVHALCYGNPRGTIIDSCFSCLDGGELSLPQTYFKDLMMLRKCYKFMTKSRGVLPNTLSAFVEKIVCQRDIDEEVKERIAFCFSVFLQDGVLVLPDVRAKQSRTNTNEMLFDIPGVIDPNGHPIDSSKPLFVAFKFGIQISNVCYSDAFAISKQELQLWLQDVQNLRQNLAESLPSSCDLQELNIEDNDTAIKIPSGNKRKHLDLQQYLKTNDSSVIADTLDINETTLVEKPKKFRRISVSKKTLKSVW